MMMMMMNKGSLSSTIYLWQAIQDRLPTLICIQKCEIVGDTTCILCGTSSEDRDHQFKLCLFTQALQCKLNSFLGPAQWTSSFDDEVSHMCKVVKRKTAKASLLTMCWTELVYHTCASLLVFGEAGCTLYVVILF